MSSIKLDIAKSGVVITEQMKAQAQQANELLHSGKGAGSDFLGWVHLPSSIDDAQIAAIEAQAEKLRAKAEVVICIGIGGSYLGAKAVYEAMNNSFEFLRRKHENPTVLFAGQNISEDYTYELLDAVKDYSIAAIVISKSGTTTEPAIAFRIIKAEIEKRYGKEDAATRIVAVTDKARGALKTLATNEGYPTFVIPDDVGGRFSVLTPVGLLPLAVAGVDIKALVAGATAMEKATDAAVPVDENISAQYAIVRNELYREGKKTEILGSYEPKLQYVGEWWKQLYGESEGKDGKGIFPASVTLTADLHSMGQYNQPHGRAGRAAGSHRRRRAQHPRRDPDHRRRVARRPDLLLREGVRHQRLPAGREPLQPAGCRGLQEEHVRPARQTRIRGGVEAHQGTSLKRLRPIITRASSPVRATTLYYLFSCSGNDAKIGWWMIGVNDQNCTILVICFS